MPLILIKMISGMESGVKRWCCLFCQLKTMMMSSTTLQIKPCISHIDNISLLHENLEVDTSKPSITIVEVTSNCFLHCSLVYHEEWGASTTSHMEPSDILNLCVYWCIFFQKILNSLTAIDCHDSQIFNELLCSLVTSLIFVRC